MAQHGQPRQGCLSQQGRTRSSATRPCRKASAQGSGASRSQRGLGPPLPTDARRRCHAVQRLDGGGGRWRERSAITASSVREHDSPSPPLLLDGGGTVPTSSSASTASRCSNISPGGDVCSSGDSTDVPPSPETQTSGGACMGVMAWRGGAASTKDAPLLSWEPGVMPARRRCAAAPPAPQDSPP